MRVGVIGGGIVGIASAYYLADRDADVTVFERDTLGGGSTGRANGGIRAQFTSPINVALSQRSIAVWETFAERFDTDIAYRRPGYLFLARTEATAERFRGNVETQRDFGVPSRYLTPEGAREVCPGLAVDRYVGATYSPEDGFADPHLALQGFAGAAVERGASIRTGVEVTDVHTDDGAVVGLEAGGRAERFDTVVNAAGPWAPRVAAMVGRELPIAPKRRMLAVLEPERPVPDGVPFTVDPDRDVHFRPEREGNVVAGGFFADEDPDRDPDEGLGSVPLGWAATLIERLAEGSSYFGPEATFRRGWAGLYSVTPDHHPVIEEGVPGFVDAVGFSGHGFMHSPATGQVVADLVLDGATDIVEVDRLRADRFERDAALVERTILD